MAKTTNTTPPADDADDTNRANRANSADGADGADGADDLERTQPIRRRRTTATPTRAAAGAAVDGNSNAAPDVRPTEQIPIDPTPVSATAAAAGGATGLDSGVSSKDSVFRRHPIATGVTAGVLAVVLVSGLTAWGVGTAVTASLTSQTAPTAPLSTATPVTGGQTTAGRVAFRATIQTIDASTWTIMTKKGETVTVTIDGSTQFGTKAMAETASSFAVGDTVVIVATKSGDTATATRVVNASALGGRLGKGLGASSGTGTATTPMAPMTPAPTSTSTSNS